MSDKRRKPKRCYGYDEQGRYFGCENPPGTPWSPNLCAECDKRRLARLDAQFAALLQNEKPR